MGKLSAAFVIGLMCALLGACRQQEDKAAFPAPQRPVAPIVSSAYRDEDARDSVGEFETVMRLAEVRPGMSVADIGAGEGYYTVRLAPIVGREGRVLAEDIVPQTIRALGQRVQRERLDNVAIRLGQPNDPQLPDGSFDRILMIHMYHEIEQPFGLLYNLWPSLRPGARVGILDTTRPTNQHGTPPALLKCELEAMGYRQTSFHQTSPGEYLAVFTAPENEAALTAPDRVKGRLDALGCDRIARQTAEGGA